MLKFGLIYIIFFLIYIIIIINNDLQKTKKINIELKKEVQTAIDMYNHYTVEPYHGDITNAYKK